MAVMLTFPVRFRVFGARARVKSSEFPHFLPKDVEKIRDPSAREFAKGIQRLPVKVSVSNRSIMSSCVKPLGNKGAEPIVLLHGFDSSCLEWRYTYPLLEDAGLENLLLIYHGKPMFYDILAFLPPSDVAAKREHLYQFWRSYIERPMVLVGPSLGAAVAIDFATNYPEAVEKLVLIDASVYVEGTGNMRKLPKAISYAGVTLLKSFPLRIYATFLAFNTISVSKCYDWTNVGRLHCLLPWWEDATVEFMESGGYKVGHKIKQVSLNKCREADVFAKLFSASLALSITSYTTTFKIKQKTLILWGENDRIISNTFAQRLNADIPNSVLHQIPECGHLPHIEKPETVSDLIQEFLHGDHGLQTTSTYSKDAASR